MREVVLEEIDNIEEYLSNIIDRWNDDKPFQASVLYSLGMTCFEFRRYNKSE